MAIERNPNIFANNPLDRAGVQRMSADWIAKQLADSATLIAPFWRLKPFVMPSQEPSKPGAIGWLRPGSIKSLAPEGATCVFLGLEGNVAHFALDISSAPDPEHEGPLTGLGKFIDLRSIAPDLEPGDAAILSQGKSLLDWHARHQFCAVCGQATTLAEGGYKRHCGNCNAEHFPRTDPVVITLIVKDDQCLLGRGKDWPEGMFSAIAGFVEPGESMEEAAARETKEETGIDITKVRYHSTQPWPFPSSLMIGCIAEADTMEITLGDDELADAKWVHRNDIVKILKGNGDGSLWLPPPMAIAHQLLRNWVNEGVDGKPDYSAYDS